MSQKVIDPLYSLEGGPPQGYKCCMPSNEPDATQEKLCGYLYPTAKGIELHLATVHNFRTTVTQTGQLSQLGGTMGTQSGA